ncbi:PTS sugar transporter subunit IIA [Treponema sp. OMZ 840]|uniref:PTS sugar transporter subunit IIA n=1 Tax=Treponema sp. OMZ 840 TaxID=244313 RepID=UPI003D9333A7
MLAEFILKHKTYRLKYRAQTWQEAIKSSVDLLIASGCAEERYYASILENVKEFGPYFVIAPGIAMPHARPEQGALAVGFSLITLETPVVFGHKTNDPVDILLCISAPDKESLNEKAIIDVMTLFDNEKSLTDLRQAETETDLEKIFKNMEE